VGEHRGIFLFGDEKNRLWIEFRSKKRLFFPDIFDLVTDKRTDDENDHEEKYIKEDTGSSQKPEVDAHATDEIVLRNEHEDDSQDKADNYTILEKPIIVFFPLVEKAKDNPQDQIQYFKQHTYTLS
jgi:hypothetical protein